MRPPGSARPVGSDAAVEIARFGQEFRWSGRQRRPRADLRLQSQSRDARFDKVELVLSETNSMRNPWAAGALACALIAIVPANLAAQTPEPAAVAAHTSTPEENLAAWGLYARLAGQTVQEAGPASRFRLHWRWESPGQALIQEWYRISKDSDKPAYTMTLRLGSRPGTFSFKGTAMMGKEWVGTLNDDGSVSYVGQGLLKMRYTVRIGEQGDYEEIYYNNGYVNKYVSVPGPAAPAVLAQEVPVATPAQAPAPTTTPVPAPAPAQSPAPVVATAPPVSAPEKAAPVVARQQPAPPAKPIKAPRRLTQDDLQKIWQDVQASRARSLEQARQIELARQEGERQAALQIQRWAAERAQREAEEAAEEAELEAERQQKAAAWNAMARANEQALNDSLQSLRDTTARIQSQQAQAPAPQTASADPLGAAERQRQVELIRQANQRQDDIANGYAAQRQQQEQSRAAAPPSLGANASQPRNPDAGRASTDTDANRCVTSAEVRVNDTFRGNTAAYVTNGCGTPVDVRICLMADKGWNCGVRWGLAAQDRYSHSTFNATGPVFVDAKVAGSGGKLASPN